MYVKADLAVVFLQNKSMIVNGRSTISQMMKEFAGDTFKIDENGRRFSKQVENAVGKEEIARDEQFLLFPECFQKTFTADT